MKKIDKILLKMRPAPVDPFIAEFDLDVLNMDETIWLLDYLRKSKDGDDGSKEDQLYCDSLLEKAHKAVNTNVTS